MRVQYPLPGVFFEATGRIEPAHCGFVPLCGISRSETDYRLLRRRRESNPRIVVLQTTAFPLRHGAVSGALLAKSLFADGSSEIAPVEQLRCGLERFRTARVSTACTPWSIVPGQGYGARSVSQYLRCSRYRYHHSSNFSTRRCSTA